MGRAQIKRQIIQAIRDNFEVVNEDFVEDEEFGFIELSINNEKFESHGEFNTKLAEILNKLFPGRKNPIYVDNCDSLNDILHNNFNL